MNDNLSTDVQNAAEQFGFNWWLLFTQVFSFALFLATIGLPLAATIHCLRYHRTNSSLPLWLLLTWLIPIVGPLCTFAALRRQPTTQIPN